jgi:putative transcriptional regulator
MTLVNLSMLDTPKARAVRFSTVEAICETLSCLPGDIVRSEPEHAKRPSSAPACKRPAGR